MVNGGLLVRKPRGISSFDVIRALQPGAKAMKIGHTGTLDPFAEGLLIILVGKAVKLAEYFLNASKTYRGTWCFGETSASLDPTTPIQKVRCVIPSYETLKKQAHTFTQKPYEQIPPMFSAKKKEGKRLYELARLGQETTRSSKTCFLKKFTMESYEPPHVTFEVTCSSGTYIRTLVKDFAESLGSMALLKSLLRTQSGGFELKQAWTLEAISEHPHWEELPCFVPFDQLMKHYPQAQATPSEGVAIAQGKQEVVRRLLQEARDSETVGIYQESQLIAIAQKKKELWHLKKVFIEAF